MIQEAFNVLPAEIEIAKPDVVIFFTGHDYDETIEALFGRITKATIPEYSEKVLARIQDSNGRLPTHSYRTYHPGYFIYGKMGLLAGIIDTIRQLVV